MSSLEIINQNLQADIIALCETKLGTNAKGLLEESLNKKQYKIFPKFTKPGKEGLVLAIKHNTFKTTLEVTNSKLKTIVAVRMYTGTKSIRIILGYAPQETDDEETRELFYNELELEVKLCIEAGDLPLVIGDFNAKIEPSDSSPYGTPMSNNGTLFHNLLVEHDLHVLNFDKEKCLGKWTHVIRNSGASSVLDYIAVDTRLKNCIKNMTIDECAIYCPYRAVKKKGTYVNTLSDHNTILLSLEVPRAKVERKEYVPTWIFKPERFSDMAATFDMRCDSIDTKQEETQLLYDKFENLVDSTLDMVFKKNKICHKQESFVNHVHFSYRPLCRKLTEFAARGKIQRKVANQYRSRILKMNTETVASINRAKLQKRVANLSENDNFSAQKFWKTRKSVRGTQQTCTSVFNQEGIEVFDEELIIEAYRSEFDQRLSSVEIKPELQTYKELTDKLCEEIIKLTSSKKEPDFTFDELKLVISNLKKGKASGPDKKPAEVYIFGGEKMQRLLLHVINRIKNSQVIPKQWEMMLITTIYKSKGSKKDLINLRGIFLTQVVCKIWESLIKERTKLITRKINKLQVGSAKNKSPADHTFIVRSCITRALYLNCPLYLNFYDFRQCFDKLWLEDSVISLYKLGLDNEFLSLIYKTNLNASIAVKTPMGISESFTKTAIVKQGSVSACCLCSASTGEFCEENTAGGICIGRIFRNLAYVDDVILINTTVFDANTSHLNFCFFADKKKQPLNELKCFLLPVNCKKTDPIPVQEVNFKPVAVKEKVEYLGDIFNQKGNFKDLIADRVRRGTVCTINTMAECSDADMGRFALNSILLLYRTVFLKTVLFNSETWNNLSKNDISQLSAIQNKYIKWMMHTPRGTCTSFTLLELGLLPIASEIEYRKLCFLHHILNLPDDDPVKEAYEDQKLYTHEPNWYNEVCVILRKYGIDVDEENIRSLSKEKWKDAIHKTISEDALNTLMTDCSSKSKTKNLVYTSLSRQPYFENLSSAKARLNFQLRGGVFDVKCNRSYMYQDTQCRLCGGDDESVAHVLNDCVSISRSSMHLADIHNLSEEETLEMLARIETFKELVEQKD